MKCGFIMRTLSLAFASLICVPSMLLAAERVYVVAADATWPPMEMLDENKQVAGYAIDYINAVAKEAGIRVDVRNTAWDGIFAALGSNQADIIASSVTITDKRKKAMDFSDPYCEIYQSVVVPAGSPVKTLADLKGKKVGGQIGTTGLIQTMPNSKVGAVVKTYDEVGLALEDLAKGNLDAVICDGPVAAYYANKKQEYKDKLKVAFTTSDVEHYGFAIRKGDRELQTRLNAGIKAVKEKGIEKQIKTKWLGE